jgi:deazaflavin-dependent oxidoreductase (nitroreductase family)
MPNIRWLLALITHLHRFVYLKSGGWLGGRSPGKRFLLLWNTGRKTGEQRITPLLYVEDGARWIVVASNAGDARPPAWWFNLEAKPHTRIQIGREVVDIRAQRADAQQSERLWPLLESAYGQFLDYRETAGREIPVVILEREVAAGPAKEGG